MTLLADALRRIAEKPDRPAAPVSQFVESCSTDVFAVADYPLVETQAIAESVQPSEEPKSVSSEPSAERGSVRLYCDLVGEERLAYLTAAQSCDLIVHVDASGGLPTERTPSPDEFEDAAIRWPGLVTPGRLPTASSVDRYRLSLGNAGLDPRDWVLFLDSCRSAYNSTGLIVPAAARKVIDWLAERCDEAFLVAHAGATDTATARRTASHLRLSTPQSPTCLLVRAG